MNYITEATSTSDQLIEYRCPASEQFAFERVPGFEPVDGHHLSPLCYGHKYSSLTSECTQFCRKNYACKAIVLDYRKFICYGLMAEKAVQVKLRISTDKDYFEGICVPRHVSCNKMWVTERIIDQTFQDILPKLELPFVSLPDCRFLCFEEKHFTCTAYSFDTFKRTCRLYDQDRHSGSTSLTFFSGFSVYENQCAFRYVRCRYLNAERDVTMVSVTSSLKVASVAHCQYACDNEKTFTCRSFTFVDDTYRYGSDHVCLLSSDNRATAKAGWTRYLQRAFYYEKECQPVVYPRY